MKKRISLFFAAAVFALCSCGGGNDSPSGVVLQMFDAAKECDAYKVMELQDLSAYKEMMKSTAEEMKSAKFEVLSEEIDESGEKAEVKIKVTKESGSSDEETIKLNKVDGKWKVSSGLGM